MAITIVDADVQWEADPSVSYIADDWVIWVGIIAGTAPPGSLATMDLTSSGGGSMTVFNTAADLQYRYNCAYMKATASGTSTWSYTTSGTVDTFFHRGAIVVRGAPTNGIEIYTFSFASQSPSESVDTFTDTVSAGFAGLLAALAGRVAVTGDFSGFAGLSLDSVTPSDLTDNALFQNPGLPGDEHDVWVAGDEGANTSWTAQHSVSTPPFHPYGTSRGIVTWVFGESAAPETSAYWGINATAM